MGGTINKKLKAKVVHKHETAADWELSSYIPDVGEIVFYDPDETHNYTRQKNGDGVNMVKDLPFAANGYSSDFESEYDEGVEDTTYHNKIKLDAQGATFEIDSSYDGQMDINDIKLNTGYTSLNLSTDGRDGTANFEVIVDSSSMSFNSNYNDEPLHANFSIDGVDSATINGKEIATEEYVDNAIENIPTPDIDLTGYATEEYVDSKTEGYEYSPFVEDEVYSTHEGAKISTPKTEIEISEQYDGIAQTIYSARLTANNARMSLVDRIADESGPLAGQDLESGFSVEGVDRATVNGKEIATEEYVDNAIENIPEQVQADWKQTDETAPDYIKNKLGLESGEAAKTTQQPGSLAISEGATAFGESNFAGLKGFIITNFDDISSGYTLDSAIPTEIEVGASFSTQIRLNYYRQGTITAISSDRLTVTVDNYIPKSTAENNYFWFIDYPTAGTIDLGDYAFSAGAESKATQFAATAIGYGNEAIGKYSTAFGRQTEAHYAAFAAGYDTHAINEEAIALGYSSTASGKISTAIGQGLKATEKNQTVLGRYNEEDPNALLIVGNGTKDTERSNAFTIGFDGQLKTPFEPTADENLVNKKYVDRIQTTVEGKLDTFQDRLANIEAGFVTIDTNDSVIELPKMPENEVIISKIGGKTIGTANLAKSETIIVGGNANKIGANFTYYEDKIVVDYTSTGKGTFAFGVELDVKPNTIYRMSFDRAGTGISVGTAYFYTNKLWGTGAPVYSPSAGTTKNIVKFTENYLTFNSGEYSKLYIGLYSGNTRTAMTETFDHFMIKEGDKEIAYVPAKLVPCKTTSIKTYTASNSLIATYTVPSTIQNLPGYGYMDSVVDFMSQTYSYRTADGKNYSSIPTIISIADIITEAPRLNAASEGTVKFINSKNAAIDASILYKKDIKLVEVIDNLNSTDSAAALSANMGRELSEKMVGYSNTYSDVGFGDQAFYDTDLRISRVDPNGSALVLDSQFIDHGNANITTLYAGKNTIKMLVDGDGWDYIDLAAGSVTKNGEEIATEEYVNEKTTGYSNTQDGNYSTSLAISMVDHLGEESNVFSAKYDDFPDTRATCIKAGEGYGFESSIELKTDRNDNSTSINLTAGKVNITAQQTIITGDLIIEGTDGIKRQIVFNTDGTIGWAPVPSSN